MLQKRFPVQVTRVATGSFFSETEQVFDQQIRMDAVELKGQILGNLMMTFLL